MAINFKSYSRLEPRPFERNLQAGFAACIHDPVWFLARQWQMGEHQGENASSPVWVSYDLSSQPVKADDPRFDPTQVPAEAIVESEINDWWTMGRRVRIGKRVASQIALPARSDLRFYKPSPPYEHFHEQFDGLALWRGRAELGIPADLFGEDIPPDSQPVWNSEQLFYEQTLENSFAVGENKLTVLRHRGGRLDWYSVNAFPGQEENNVPVSQGNAIPTPLQYPAAPNSRWWQIEDAELDPGVYVPDSAHTPTAMLTELVFSHSDDWFLFPVLAHAGHVVSMTKMEVRDSFGRVYSSLQTNDAGEPTWEGLQPPKQWTLFQVVGLDATALVLWHVAEQPLESIPLERVQFGIDEESNLLWAVELTVDGREVASRRAASPDETLHPKFNAGKPGGDARAAREYAYVPAQGIVSRWHPYELEEVDGQRWLVQRSLLDLSRQKPLAMPSPEALVLQSEDATHRIAPLAIPSNGIEVKRRWQLARDMNGLPVLWIQRQREPSLSPPSRRLRFDVMEAANE